MTAQDAAGNTGDDFISVTYNSDPIFPTVTITSPTSGSSYTSFTSPISIGGTAFDNIGVTSVTWTNDRGGSGTCSGTTFWSSTGIVLYNGLNIITVTAHDAAGNAGDDFISIYKGVVGDTNGDGLLDLADVITGLMVLVEMNPSYLSTIGDVNGDGKIGLYEILYGLEQISQDEK